MVVAWWLLTLPLAVTFSTPSGTCGPQSH